MATLPACACCSFHEETASIPTPWSWPGGAGETSTPGLAQDTELSLYLLGHRVILKGSWGYAAMREALGDETPCGRKKPHLRVWERLSHTNPSWLENLNGTSSLVLHRLDVAQKAIPAKTTWSPANLQNHEISYISCSKSLHFWGGFCRNTAGTLNQNTGLALSQLHVLPWAVSSACTPFSDRNTLIHSSRPTSQHRCHRWENTDTLTVCWRV